MENIHPRIETMPINIDSAISSIEEIRQRIALMGANDNEFWLIDQIIEKMEKGDLLPDEALSEASKILDSKQDYH